jgi:hypothetical protein
MMLNDEIIIMMIILNQHGIEKDMIIQVEEVYQIIQHLNTVKVNEYDGDYQQKMN